MNRDTRPHGVAGRPLRWPAFSLALVAAAVLAGCADMSGIAPVAKLGEPALPAASAASTPADAATTLDARWWRGFGDAQLDGLMDRALSGNPSLRVAQARLARAQAVIEVADAAVLPQLNGSLDATRQLYTKNGAVPAPLARRACSTASPSRPGRPRSSSTHW